MKTIIHLELSDEDRRDLARRIDRNPVTKRLVTRKEVTELVLTLVDDEVTKGWESTTDDRGDDILNREDETQPERRLRTIAEVEDDEPKPFKFIPSRGDEPYLFKSKDPEMTKLCSAILDATNALDEYVWRALEENRA